MQAGDRQQGWHGRELAIDAAVAKNQHADVFFFDHAPRHDAQFFHRFDQTDFTTCDAEQDGQHTDFETWQVHTPQAREFFVCQHRTRQLKLPTIGRPRL